jgi:hypothetical protein
MIVGDLQGQLVQGFGAPEPPRQVFGLDDGHLIAPS